MSGTRNTSQGDNHGTQIQIGSVGGAVSIHQPEARTVRILPQRGTSVFQNRTEELALLDTLLERAESGAGGWLWSVVGGPAVGKTTLVLTWIIQNRHRFGHAQLAVACGGDPGAGRGRGAEQVCDEYFHAVGVDTDAPGFDTLEGKLSLFRQHTEGRPVVILLDDVRTAAQVEPFLSDLPGTVVITTSRVPVRGLGMRRPAVVQVGPLADEAVTALFDDVLGPGRRTAEPEAFTRLVALCGGIPLFAGYAAGLLYDAGDLSVAELADRMEQSGRIDFLEEVSEAATRPAAVFDVPYQALDPDAARLYRALGTHPTRDFDAWLARAYFPEEPERGTGALRQLLDRALVKTDWAGRYVMEDLTYEHAAWVARTRGSARERRLDHQRTRGYYLFGAVAADTARRWKLGPLYGKASPYPLPDFTGARHAGAAEPPESVGEPLDQWLKRRRRVRERSALLKPREDEWRPGPAVWFEANLEAILACVESTGRVWDGSRPEPGYAWQMAEATNAYFTAHGRIDERLTLLALAARDAEACADADATARVRAQWGEALLGRGRLAEARHQLELSLEAARTEGADPRGRGAALEWLGILERRQGDRAASERLLDESLPFLDHTRVRPLALHHMHRGDTALGDHDHGAAAGHYEESLRLFGEHALQEGPDHANEGKVLERLARLAEKDDPARSVTLLHTALGHFLAADRAYQIGKALERLGDLGEDAEQRWTTAAEVFDLVGAAGAADRVRGKLG